MTWEIWSAFVLASAVLLAIPGPTVAVVVGHALANGPRAARATAPGVVMGDFIAMTASLLGAGAVLAASATLFAALKFAGAVYLIWFGVKLIRSRPSAPQPGRGATGWAPVFWNCCLVTALNPKDILFFVAFVPQFVDPAQPLLPQFLVLEATFLTMVAINITIWTLAAGGLRDRLGSPRRIAGMNRMGGAMLVGAGVWAART